MKYEINLGKNALEDLFKDEKGRKTQEIVPMDIKELKPYAEQPFKVFFDNSMDELEYILTSTKPESIKLVIYEDKLRRYFPKSYTKEQIEDTVMKLIQKWHKNREKENER